MQLFLSIVFDKLWLRYREEPDCYLHYGRHDWAPAKISIGSVAKNQINVYE